MMIGAGSDTRGLAETYLRIVVCCGPFILISNCYSNVVRTEGESGKAMMGQLLGNLLNVVLDPVMILGFGWNSVILTAVCYLFTNQIVSAFLTDATAFDYAVSFVRILLTTSFLFGVFYVLINALQAMGAATASLIINLSRQGIIFIPALFILQAVFGMTGLVWAQPVADILSIVFAAVLYINTFKKLRRNRWPGSRHNEEAKNV